jgi:hypothetical protein
MTPNTRDHFQPMEGYEAGVTNKLEVFRTRYPRIKAAVYWHERWQNPDQSYSNLRVNSSVESLKAYRGVANPDWHGELMLRASQIPAPDHDRAHDPSVSFPAGLRS